MISCNHYSFMIPRFHIIWTLSQQCYFYLYSLILLQYEKEQGAGISIKTEAEAVGKKQGKNRKLFLIDMLKSLQFNEDYNGVYRIFHILNLVFYLINDIIKIINYLMKTE